MLRWVADFGGRIWWSNLVVEFGGRIWLKTRRGLCWLMHLEIVGHYRALHERAYQPPMHCTRTVHLYLVLGGLMTLR
jgi:hypothetical protein